MIAQPLPHGLKLASLVFSLLPALAGAQESPAPANLLRNGDFEARPQLQENFYDGVDKEGRLRVELTSVPVLAASGGLVDRRLPPSVSLTDLNRDGKVDIVAALPGGFMYVYFNQGEHPAEPRFTHAEILPLFLSRSTKGAGEDDTTQVYDRTVPRLSLVEWSKPGALDIICGNLFGQLFHVTAGANTPERVTYANPRKLESAEIATHSIPFRYWGNLFAPQVTDWDNDGKRDIILGEGSYSANSIFLLHNKSTSIPPKFDTDDRYYLVLGEGREQLVPTLADFNGDGRLDLLVADNQGVVTVHLRPENWKLGDVLPNTSTLSLGGKERQGSPITLHAGDYNGDGLFDLLLGDVSGHLKIAINRGAAQEPSFPTVETITGVDTWKDNISMAPHWALHNPKEEGNALGYSRVVSQAEDPASLPPQGAQCLLLANFTPINTIVQPPPHPTMADGKIEFRLHQGVRMEHGARYTLVAMVKGHKVRDVGMRLEASVKKKNGIAKVELDDRAAVPKGFRWVIEEGWSEGATVTPGTDWTKLTHTFTARLKTKELRDVPNWTCNFNIYANLPATDSHIYLDDVRIFKVE